MQEQDQTLLNRDITKMTQEELQQEVSALRNHYRRLRTVIENSYDGIYVTDRYGNTLYINKAYTVLSGLSFDDVKNLNALELEGRFLSKAVTPLALTEKRPVTMSQTLYRTNRQVLVTSNPILNDEGEVEFFILNIRDITELEALKRNLSSAEQQAYQYLQQVNVLQEQLFSKSQIIAQDIAMLKTLSMAHRVAETDSTVLLTGETGVGKEEVAKYIHSNSKRADRIFITVNCGSIPANLIESELFGYESGAFTGAKSKGKVGLFEAASGGTLFLDELGELPLDMQVKLLRVLQNQEIIRVGGVAPIKIDVRVITATNRNLPKMVKEGTFRADLFYRISVVPIEIPPLRERKRDIVPLAEYFLEKLNEKYGFHKEISDRAKRTLIQYDWPGNVRELNNVIERAAILSDSEHIESRDFPFFTDGSKNLDFSLPEEGTVLSSILEQIEYSYMEKAYQKYGNVRKAAEMLGLKRSTFAGRLRQLKAKYGTGDE